MKYKRASHTDSAKALFTHLIEDLTYMGHADTHLALKAEVQLADILIKREEDFATGRLLSIVERATAKEAWDVVSFAHTLLALVYEILGQKEKCEQNLLRAKELIQVHQLTKIYPTYAVRKSSYYRIFDINQDSALHYAREALLTAPDEADENRGSAYFLLGRLRQDINNRERISYFQQAAWVFKKNEDYVAYAAMLRNISDVFMENQEADSADHYNRLALHFLPMITSPYRIDYYGIKSALLLMRADLYHQSGQFDSAWKYINLHNEVKDELSSRLNVQTAMEVEARYYDDKKSQQIEQQRRRIQFERMRRNLAITGLILVLISAFVLIYFYLQVYKANKKIRQQAESLAHLDEAKSRFFANISHELRTPLTLMLGPIQSLLKTDSLNEHQQRLLILAKQSGDQLKNLINEILTLRKLEMGKLEAKLEPTLLASFFRSNVSQFESLAEIQAIKFEQNLSIEDQLLGYLDREKVRQIVNNLLSNAFKFTPSGGKVSIKIAIQKKQLFLTVSDSGEGIHPDDLPYIFDRFFQSNRTDRPLEGGTGIGLALCREYIKLLGGSIKVKSKVGMGTRFLLSFPIEVIHSIGSQPTPSNGSKTSLESKEEIYRRAENGRTQPSDLSKILLAENNAELSKYLQLVLSVDYEIVSVDDGKEAWKAVMDPLNRDRKAPFDLILSDLMMPLMDGFQLAEKLKANDQTRHIPLIILTARTDIQDKLKALRIGVDDYLYKPFDEEELRLRIANLLRLQEARRQVQSLSAEKEEKQVYISQEDQQWLTDFESYVQANLSNTTLDVPMLADHFAMSESTLRRQLKRLIGLTPNRYLIEVRLQKARQLLETRAYKSVSQVAYESGYTDPKSFSRAYKRKFGKSPSLVIED